MADTDLWSSWTNLAGVWWTRHAGVPAEGLARHRLGTLLRYARERSPFYRRHYARLPAGDVALAALPVVDKRTLMAHFDDWCTDPRVRLAQVREFLADRRRIGERFLGRYWVWKSSGTSGVPGIFLHDLASMAVYDALVATALEDVPWNASNAARVMAGGGRAALVVATGDHFASVSSWERMRRAFPRMDARSFSILAPLPQLVRELDEYRPAFLAGYASILALLARERRAGRLAIAPALVWSGGEHLAPAVRAAIQGAFGCPVANEYGASECLSIAHECREGWQHLHCEWVMLEAVDRDGRPTPAGRLSDDALLTNLANRIQPVIRYALGDRIRMGPHPCACGAALPAFRVEGRAERTLALKPARGPAIHLAPLALATVVEEAAGDRPFQIAQVAPATLALRFEGDRGPKLAAARRRAAQALRSYLAAQSLPEVELVQDPAPPRRDPRSGKLRAVVVERLRKPWPPPTSPPPGPAG